MRPDGATVREAPLPDFLEPEQVFFFHFFLSETHSRSPPPLTFPSRFSPFGDGDINVVGNSGANNLHINDVSPDHTFTL